MKVLSVFIGVRKTVAFLGLMLTAGMAHSQENAKPVVTILLPLQLDSLYKMDQYKYGNTIPKFALPYLEFYNGVQYAADTLRREGTPARLQIIDTRKAGANVAQILQEPNVKQSNLLIAVAQSGAEIKLISDFARMQAIPLISATYPNDGGVKDNPDLYLVNSTLRTHCAGIYRYLQQNHSTDKLVVFTRKGSVETYLKTWLDEAANSTRAAKLPLQFVNLPDSFNASQIKYLLDSTRRNLVLGASLDASFSKSLVQNLATLTPTYETLVMGMPTWDEIDFRKPEYKGVDVMYSTPFVSLSSNIDAYNSMTKYYLKNLNSRPSDMAIKGYELTYRFVKAINKWSQPDSFAAHINERSNRVFCDFEFQPVTEANNRNNVYYYENKKLYFIRKTDGNVTGIY